MATIEVTVSEFKRRFKAFTYSDGGESGHSDQDVQGAIDEAREFHNVKPLATLNCAAHLLAIGAEDSASPDGGSGVVISEGVGPKRVQYATQVGGSFDADGKAAFFATTSYGRKFLSLETRTPRRAIGAMVV